MSWKRSRAKIVYRQSKLALYNVELGKKTGRVEFASSHYAWHSRFDVAEDDSGNLFKDQRRHPGGVLLILCGIFGKVSLWFFDFDMHQIEC